MHRRKGSRVAASPRSVRCLFATRPAAVGTKRGFPSSSAGNWRIELHKHCTNSQMSSMEVLQAITQVGKNASEWVGTSIGMSKRDWPAQPEINDLGKVAV